MLRYLLNPTNRFSSHGIITIALLVTLHIGCDQHPATTNTASVIHIGDSLIQETDEYIRISMDSIANWFPEQASQVAIEHDHSLHIPKTYTGYAFRSILDSLVARFQLADSQTQLIFECKDGYLPSNTLAELLSSTGGYIVYADSDAAKGEYWPEELKSAYAPYYLVWKGQAKDDHSLAWPYGWVAIRILKEDPYKPLYPTNAPELASSFYLYKRHCLKCHALNRIGGVMGPEFNIPKNITEYWTRENIISFAQNPASFRVNAKMYAIRSLSKEELNGIVDYLAYMAKHKLTE